MAKEKKKVGGEQVPVASQIKQAAQASRSMTIQQRAQVMIKAGLVSQSQAEEGIIRYQKEKNK